MGDLTYRAARAGDIPALHRLIESAYRGDSARRGWTSEADMLGGQRTDAEDLAGLIADPRRAILMAQQDGVLVGCVLIENRGEGLAYFGMLSIDPDRQAAGLGRRLLAIAEAEAVWRFGARRMEMRVIPYRPELIAWYGQRGYALTGAEEPFPADDPRKGVPLRDDLKFVVMARDLA